jgi:hypothetical protein
VASPRLLVDSFGKLQEYRQGLRLQVQFLFRASERELPDPLHPTPIVLMGDRRLWAIAFPILWSCRIETRRLQTRLGVGSRAEPRANLSEVLFLLRRRLLEALREVVMSQLFGEIGQHRPAVVVR